MLKSYGINIAGVDEAGRGPLAGPVVSAAFIMGNINEDTLKLIDDSKKLSESKRDYIYEHIKDHASIGIAEVFEIDSLNILEATLLSMRRAVSNLPKKPNHVYVDGNSDPKIQIPTTLVVKGDSTCLEIAAASIVAKVTRDRIMNELDKEFPKYNWRKNKGYGTKEHRIAIKETGLSKYHRKSFNIKY